MIKVLRINKEKYRETIAYFSGREIFEACRSVLEESARSDGEKMVVMEDVLDPLDFEDYPDMVMVHSDTLNHSERIACFRWIKLYDMCLPHLKKYVQAAGMTISEKQYSCNFDRDAWREPLWASIKEKYDTEKLKGANYWID